MKVSVTGVDLTQSSRERFVKQANYKRTWFILYDGPDSSQGMNRNAVLLDIVPVTGNKLYTARAIFTIDREANGVPFNFDRDPGRRFFNRSVYIRQTKAEELVQAFGICGTIYLGIEGDIPANTQDLTDVFRSRFGLDLSKDDIVSHPIGKGVSCVTVTFSKMSLGYTGSFRVDLTTPVVNTPQVPS